MKILTASFEMHREFERILPLFRGQLGLKIIYMHKNKTTVRVAARFDSTDQHLEASTPSVLSKA